ncbi:protein MEI2-like 7 [Humulus lupulus]|uniref:protein MEI2-like 7 n=1 Tax=Humulus lupulus TaxID=3486 RepID=UPI002B41278F|nr:protein MEI2-like 7 [Humulus lupulus]
MAKPLNPNATPFFSRTKVLANNAHFHAFNPSFGETSSMTLVVLPRRPVYLYSTRPSSPPPRRRLPNPVWTRKEVSPATMTVKPVASDDDDENTRSSTIIPFPGDFYDLQWSNSTTVMVKNIPNYFRRGDMIRILDEHCRSSGSKYNFLYLPMDFNQYWNRKKIVNLGYGFVNFTSSEGAWTFFEAFHKFSWSSSYQSTKVCEVVLAKIQGLDSLRASFVSKNFYCKSKEYLPIVFLPGRDGTSSSATSGQGFNIGIKVETRPRHPIRSTHPPQLQKP